MKIARLLIATSNRGKLAEFRALFPAEIAVVGLDSHPEVVLPEETGLTYSANARLKAEAAARATGLPSLGDDSGLEVSALGGRPGLYSARFAETRAEGEAQDAANRRKLLEELRKSGRPEAEWDARFVCALALAVPGEDIQTFSGEAKGRVISTPRGANGFGYDPLLLVVEHGKTFAELDDAEKNRLSHRGQAVQALVAFLLTN